MARVLTFHLDNKQCWVSFWKRVPVWGVGVCGVCVTSVSCGAHDTLQMTASSAAGSLSTLSLLWAPSLAFLLLGPLRSILFSCSWAHKPSFVFGSFYFAIEVTCIFFTLRWCMHAWACVGCVIFLNSSIMKSKDTFVCVLGCIRETIKKSLMDSW